MLHLFLDILRNSILITGLVIVMMMLIESLNIESGGSFFSGLKNDFDLPAKLIFVFSNPTRNRQSDRCVTIMSAGMHNAFSFRAKTFTIGEMIFGVCFLNRQGIDIESKD